MGLLTEITILFCDRTDLTRLKTTKKYCCDILWIQCEIKVQTDSKLTFVPFE